MINIASSSSVGPVAGLRRDLIPAQRSLRAEPSLSTHQPTVLIAEPAARPSDGLRMVLAEYAGCRVLRATSIPEINALLAQGITGDLAMVSVAFSIHTPTVVKGLRHSGWTRVIALAATADPAAAVLNAVAAGACGVVRMVDRAIVADEKPPGSSLSRREVQVVTLLADGLTNREIAAQLSLRAATVKNHLFRIGRKLGTGDRAHIVAKCLRGGVITTTPAAHF